MKMKPGKALAIVLVLGVGAAVVPQLCGQTQTGGTLPSAKEIVAKYDEALGGDTAHCRADIDVTGPCCCIMAG